MGQGFFGRFRDGLVSELKGAIASSAREQGEDLTLQAAAINTLLDSVIRDLAEIKSDLKEARISLERLAHEVAELKGLVRVAGEIDRAVSAAQIGSKLEQLSQHVVTVCALQFGKSRGELETPARLPRDFDSDKRQ